MYPYLHGIACNNLFVLIILTILSIFYRNIFDMKLIDEGYIYRVSFDIEAQKIEFQCDLALFSG